MRAASSISAADGVSRSIIVLGAAVLIRIVCRTLWACVLRAMRGCMRTLLLRVTQV